MVAARSLHWIVLQWWCGTSGTIMSISSPPKGSFMVLLHITFGLSDEVQFMLLFWLRHICFFCLPLFNVTYQILPFNYTHNLSKTFSLKTVKSTSTPLTVWSTQTPQTLYCPPTPHSPNKILLWWRTEETICKLEAGLIIWQS